MYSLFEDFNFSNHSVAIPNCSGKSNEITRTIRSIMMNNEYRERKKYNMRYL